MPTGEGERWVIRTRCQGTSCLTACAIVVVYLGVASGGQRRACECDMEVREGGREGEREAGRCSPAAAPPPSPLHFFPRSPLRLRSDLPLRAELDAHIPRHEIIPLTGNGECELHKGGKNACVRCCDRRLCRLLFFYSHILLRSPTVLEQALRSFWTSIHTPHLLPSTALQQRSLPITMKDQPIKPWQSLAAGLGAGGIEGFITCEYGEGC